MPNCGRRGLFFQQRSNAGDNDDCRASEHKIMNIFMYAPEHSFYSGPRKDHTPFTF